MKIAVEGPELSSVPFEEILDVCNPVHPIAPK